jgi:ATP-binding cassette subfamily B protein
MPSFIMVCLFVFGRTMADLQLPKLMADIVNNGIAAGDTPYILKTGGEMLLVSLFGMACAIGTSYLSSRNAMGFSRDLRNKTFTKIENFGQSEFDTFGTASLITRSTNDVRQMQMLLMMGQRMMLAAPIMFIGGIINVLRTNLPLSTILIFSLPAVILSVTMIAGRATPMFDIMQKRLDRLNLVMREGLSGVRVVRAFIRDDYQQERFNKANEDLTDNAIRVNRLLALQSPVMTIIMNITIVATLWFGSLFINSGSLMIGDLMAFIQYIGMILGSLMGLSMIFIMYPRAAVSADRINEILDTQITVEQPLSEKIIPFPKNDEVTVAFDHVTFRYPGSEAPVLHDITFTASPGQTVAVIGGTGSGKSTVAQLLLRFYDMESGSITMNGVDIRNLDLSKLRERIGFVSQKTLLFTGSVADNIRYGKEDATDEEVLEALEIAQAAKFVQAMPDGIHSNVSQGGTNFSGGQKQRLSIARALVRKPPVYVFDDSFSALDFRTDANLRKAMQPMTKRSTVIIIAQRVSTIMNSDLILVMNEGRIVGQGTHEDLLAHCKVYQEILESQLSVEEYSVKALGGEAGAQNE